MQAAAVFETGEEYEFEIIRDDDGDGSLTLSVRKIQVRFDRHVRGAHDLDPENPRPRPRPPPTPTRERAPLLRRVTSAASPTPRSTAIYRPGR